MKNDQARAIFVGSGEDNRNGIYERISPYNHSLKAVEIWSGGSIERWFMNCHYYMIYSMKICLS